MPSASLGRAMSSLPLARLHSKDPKRREESLP